MISQEKAAEIINNLIANNRCYIMMIGAPGSGKTEFINRYLSSCKVFNLFDVENTLTVDAASVYDTASDLIMEQCVSELDNGHSVVYDAVNCYPKVRNVHLKNVKKHCDVKIGIIMNKSLISCYKTRFKNNENEDVQEMKLESMYFNIKRMSPNINEGFDILIDMDARDMNE